MKRYIKSNQYHTDFGEKHRYWDDPERADKITDVELPEDVKHNVLENAIETLTDKYKYGSAGHASDFTLWDLFLNYVTNELDMTLDDYPEACWPTWYEDAKNRFIEWNDGISPDPEADWDLAHSDDPRIRRRVAERTRDPEILKYLADDESIGVRIDVAAFTEDPEVLEKLKNDPNKDVRWTANKPRGYYKHKK